MKKYVLRKFKLKSFEEGVIANYSAVWECATCGQEGAHTFHDDKVPKQRMDLCRECDKEQWKEIIARKNDRTESISRV